MVERASVQNVKQRLIVGSDGGSSRGVVEESELSEGFTCFVSLEEGGVGVALENFGASKCSGGNDE